MKINLKRINPVRPWSVKGKTLVWMLRGVYLLVGLFYWKKWKSPPETDQEDPRHFKLKDILYFGYKYYFQPPMHYPGDIDVQKYFHEQVFDFTPSGLPGSKSISVSLGGDLMPYECLSAASTKHLWDECGNWFFNSDIVYANLETPIHTQRKPGMVPEVMLNHMYFNGTGELLEIFSGNGHYKGYDILSTANNHSLDMGEEGVYKTIELLKRKNIEYVGTALNHADSLRVRMLECNGIKVAFIAHTYSLNKLTNPPGKEWLSNHTRLNLPEADIASVVEDARRAREAGADFIIVALHCGNAYQPWPGKYMIDNFHRIFEQTGVDAIMGGHPHNPQPMETYTFKDPFSGKQKKGFAIYSLGDFVAYDIFKFCRMPLILKLKIEKNEQGTSISGLEVMPLYNFGASTKEGFQLKFLRYSMLEKDSSKLANFREFKEISEWYKQFILFSGIGKYTV